MASVFLLYFPIASDREKRCSKYDNLPLKKKNNVSYKRVNVDRLRESALLDNSTASVV